MILLSISAMAQISRDITKIRCGDGVLDELEMCEEGVDSDKCDKMGEILGIASACYDDECVCVPFVKKAFCGNDNREGVEMCDGTGEDFCPQFGEAIGLNLTCNTDTCICDVVVPTDYDPSHNITEEEPEGMAVCGDKKLQRAEECDPPNTLCTLEDGSVGICAEGCKCVAKESIGIEKEKTEEESKTTETNKTLEVNEDDEKITEEKDQEQDKESEETEENKDEEDLDAENEDIAEANSVAEKGFFASLWDWVKELFS